MARKREKADPGHKLISRNKRARHEYEIEDTFEAGIVLVGTEVKSLRAGMIDLSDAYAAVRDGEVFLVGLHIAPYDKAAHFNHAPRRDRKLLLSKKEISRLQIKVKERGFTLVPLELYFNEKGIAKALLGLAKGRKNYDNRDSILRDESRREMREAKKNHE